MIIKVISLVLALVMLCAVCCAAAEETEGLPAYVYTGSDPIEGTLAEMIVGSGTENYYMEPGGVTIPCPLILKTVMDGDGRATVYANLWTFNYILQGDVLFNISGGEDPAVIRMEKADGVWKVVSMEEAGDGEDYAADIIRFANGDEELEEKYFSYESQMEEVRLRFIRDYVEANGLNVTAYQDYGWDPVPLK